MKVRLEHILENGFVYGVVLTLIVTALAAAGYLDTTENWLYDKRMAWCQFFMPPPTDRLVHLDIDDPTLESVGRWPWPRSTIAEMIDEIHVAGPKVVGFDVLFHDISEVRYVKREDGKFGEIDDDREMSAALDRLGCGLIPLSISPTVPTAVGPVEGALRGALKENLELTETAASEEVRRRGVDSKLLQGVAGYSFLDTFTRTRRQVMYRRLTEEMRQGSTYRRGRSAKSCCRIPNRECKRPRRDCSTNFLRRPNRSCRSSDSRSRCQRKCRDCCVPSLR